MRKRFAVLGLLLITTLTLGCGAVEEGDPGGEELAAPVGVPMGELVTILDDDETLSIDVTVASPEQHPASADGAFRAQKGTFLVATVTIACTKGTYHANPFNFTFVSADGTPYEAAFVSFAPELGDADLASGQSATGKIAFDVPVEAISGAIIQVYGLGSAEEEAAAYWTL